MRKLNKKEKKVKYELKDNKKLIDLIEESSNDDDYMILNLGNK